MTSSQMAEQSGEKAAPTLFGIQGEIIPPYDQRNAANDGANRPTMLQKPEEPRVIVNSPPRCPVELNVQLRKLYRHIWSKLGINVRSQQANEDMRESMAGNNPNPEPETTQFAFPDLEKYSCECWKATVRFLQQPSGGQRATNVYRQCL